jgi:uncharacterized protein
MIDPRCYFVSDLHGRADRFRKLLQTVGEAPPRALFVGGDLFGGGASPDEFLETFLYPQLRSLQKALADRYPHVFVIPGNDDPAAVAPLMQQGEDDGLLFCAHNRRLALGPLHVYGYACVPPTPFLLKDWERYDVSRFVDPGCLPPEEGRHSVSIGEPNEHAATIADELAALAGNDDLEEAIFLFHAPPYGTSLDRAGLDGRMVDHAPLDVHVGSIAVRRFIEERQPLLTLHGHVHEAPRLSGNWRERIGRTHIFSAAHDGPELSLIRFHPHRLEKATRELL